jgi:hypothetical protein
LRRIPKVIRERVEAMGIRKYATGLRVPIPRYSNWDLLLQRSR